MSHGFAQFGPRNADQHCAGTRRIEQWSEIIKNRPLATLGAKFASGGNVLERGVIIGGEEKCEPMLEQRLGGCFTGKADGHSKRLEHIGASALRGGSAVSVLGDKNARGRADNRRGGRDVESSQAISACAYNIQDLPRAYWGIKVGQNSFSK